MKKVSKSLTFYICMFLALFCAMTIKAEAANVTTGTLGDNDGITWTYDADTKTLTVTGEDSGLVGVYDASIYGYKSPFAAISGDIETIIMENCTLKGSVRSLFGKMNSVQRIEFKNINTTNVTKMSFMFDGCSSLVSLDLSGFDTTNVTDISYMFSKCSSLNSLDLSGFDTSKVTTMECMFSRCSSLVKLDLRHFNTSSVTDMYKMFEDCTGLTGLDVSSFKTSNVEDMGWMFYNCNQLTGLNVSGFDTAKVTNMRSMFYKCKKLEDLDVSGFKTSNVTDMSYMFNNCNKVGVLDVSRFDTSKVKNMSNMFAYCNVLRTLDLSNFDLSKVSSVDNMFAYCFCFLTINTPKAMADNLSIALPTTYLDLKGNRTNVITKDFCNTTLTNIDYLVAEINLNNTSLSLNTGSSGWLTATILPLNAYNKTVAWKSSNTEVATVDAKGKVTAVAPGIAIITATATDGTGVSASCEVTVVRPVTGITLNETSLTLEAGESAVLTATVSPNNATNKAVTWKSSNTAVATVDANGKVTAVAPGTATITVTAADGSGKSASCEVTVTQSVTGIGLSKTSLSLQAGENHTLTATVSPNNATNKTVTWKSSDTAVATVDANGKVTAVAPGTAAITATAKDGSGVSASCSVTVTPAMSEQERQVRAFVERMYTVALGRASDPSGIDYWAEQLLSHQKDGAGISEGFIMSEEFASRNYSNEEYLKVLYRTFFNRESDEGGMSFWMSEMSAGRSRKSVLAGFVNSKEFTEICESYGINRGTMEDDATATGAGQFVERLYTIALERASDPVGLEDWAQRINSKTNTPEQVAKEFFLSPEYAGKNTSNDKYVETLYLVFMDRASETGGKAYWVGQLEQGMSREAVLEGFAQSEEFKEIMARYGL